MVETLGIGPALALIDATLAGDNVQVRLLRRTFGNLVLAGSVARAIHQFLDLRDVFDEDLVLELMSLHLSTWGAYDDFVIRQRDRLQRAAVAIRGARRLAFRTFDHYMRYAIVDAEDVHTVEPRVNPLLISRSLTNTYAMAYVASMTFVHLTTAAGLDPEDMLEQYRAAAASELNS
ncbi:hypothetical protein [Curtobacterium sp. MCBD17_040]|uniref:hypothetical protein n=1 Tax=Curtobacterium sp. MCBD17_040 TaxID=2175674 RepID=UPI000DA8D654|nr:hypothetical protein [Curtobacterium sp. MCBD17_040]WIB65615.1 hypothetical protein DEI94_15970 [Curtobacterium sp. MCBD17_040]